MAREADGRDPAINLTTPVPTSNLNTSEGIAVAEQTRQAFADVLAAIQIHGDELVNIPNVVLVQPGYRFRDASFMPEPVLSITVLRKVDLAAVPARELIPARLGKVLVDVVPATPQQQWAFLKRREYIAQEIAAYFKKLFLYDWNRIGTNDSLMLSMPLVAMPGEAPPPGMIRVPWSTVFTEWREAAEEA